MSANGLNSEKPDQGASPATPSWMRRQSVVVLVVDMVESVRLMQTHEAATVARWASALRHVNAELLPQFHGGLVKSLGDGLMARFDRVRDAAAAASAIHAHFDSDNLGMPEDARIRVRAGINLAQAFSDGTDLYGAGVNLAARLAALGGPGETIASAAARDDLTPGLDAACEDLGDCYLKHIEEPVRAFRIGQAGPRPTIFPMPDAASPVQPVIAVIPFSFCGGSAEQSAIGELVADSVIAQLSGNANLRVVSRLSTTAFRDRAVDLPQVCRHLGATYVVSGSYAAAGANLVINVELASARNFEVVWGRRLTGAVADLLQPQSALINEMVQGIAQQLFETEARCAVTQPLPTLASYSLLLGSIVRMHRSGRIEFDRTREMLEHLVERHQRIAAPRAWLAMWYVLRTTRGWSNDRVREAASALEMTRRALESDPFDSLALAVEGFVYCHLLKDLDLARRRCDAAIGVNPNQALGWLYKGVIHAFSGEGTAATEAASRALALSPIDPQRYYFESLAATAAIAARDYERAQTLAQASIRLNRTHSSTWRMLTVALVHQDKMVEARAAMKQLLALEPDLTVAAYRARMPNGELTTGREWAQTMAKAGLPPG